MAVARRANRFRNDKPDKAQAEMPVSLSGSFLF